MLYNQNIAIYRHNIRAGYCVQNYFNDGIYNFLYFFLSCPKDDKETVYCLCIDYEGLTHKVSKLWI